MPKPGVRQVAWALAAIAAGALLALAVHNFTPTGSANPADKLAAALDSADPQVRPILGAEKNGVPVDARGLLKIFQARLARYPSTFVIALPPWDASTQQEADAALNGKFTLQGVTGSLPLQADGGFDWTWRGPHNDPEFAWFLNRQHHIPALLVAWRETKDARYRRALNTQLRDWLRQTPRPAHYSFSSGWRALEVSRRIEEAWMPVLFSPIAGEALEDDVLLGMLADVPDHAAALRYTHSFSGNHLLTELTGLAAIALAFPEFKDAPQWLDYAVTQSRAEAAREIYPDGAESELSNLYQVVVLLELQRLADMLAAAGRDKEGAEMRPLLENAWNYFSHTLDPRGHGPLNNDSSVADDAAQVRQMAAIYHRPDWLYIATQGREGIAPTTPPTEYFPYAGLAVMRSGWDADAQWAFFDAGPRGSDHQHADRLHLSIGGGGREFLVDDGRYNYQPGPWRDYFTGPRGHNVVLLDGAGTLPPPDTVTTPAKIIQKIGVGSANEGMPASDMFKAEASFAGNLVNGQGPAYHQRTVNYVRGQYWIVTDEIFCAGAHKLEALWHFHPDCTVKRDGPLIYTDDVGQANLALWAMEAPPGDWTVDFIRGRETPSPQGWYSPVFNQKVPATCASFTANVNGPTTMKWVIWIVPPGQDPRQARPVIGR
jgi:hypothetical protein